MNFILLALLLLIPIPIYVAFKSLSKDRRNKKKILAIKDAYKRVTNRHLLSISEVNKFGNRLIAIDRNSGKLVLIVYKNGITWEKCLNLDEMVFCQIAKGTSEETGCIQRVNLELTFRRDGFVNFLFFDEEVDDFRDLPARIKKAQYWKKKIQYQLSRLQVSNINKTIRP
jgi:hypothetical protein